MARAEEEAGRQRPVAAGRTAAPGEPPAGPGAAQPRVRTQAWPDWSGTSLRPASGRAYRVAQGYVQLSKAAPLEVAAEENVLLPRNDPYILARTSAGRRGQLGSTGPAFRPGL